MLSTIMARVRGMAGGDAGGATVARRREAIDAAVAWWLAALRGREGIDQPSLDAFGGALARDLTTRLDQTYRVYLEVNHQPKGILRTVAVESGLNIDAFPPATTMSVSDTKVAVSKAALEPYEIVYGR